MNGLVVLNLFGFAINLFFVILGLTILASGGEWGAATLAFSASAATLNLVVAFIVSD